MADSKETIRPSTIEDIPALCALFKDVFGHDRADEVWRWKYFDNTRGCMSFLCEVGGRVVAHCGGTPVVFRDGEREYAALQSVDFMSLPGYPGGIGRGNVFVRTVEAFFAEHCGPSRIPLVYGFPGERHRLVGERVLGYREVEPVGELVLEPAGSDCKTRELLASDLDDFSEPRFSPACARDRTYLRWRYIDHPVHRYEFLKVDGGWFRRVSTSAILRRLPDAVFLMEVGGSTDVASVGRLTRQLRLLGRPVHFWCSLSHELSQKLVAAGFRPTTRNHSLEARFFSDRPNLQPGEMYFSAGDYDVY